MTDETARAEFETWYSNLGFDVVNLDPYEDGYADERTDHMWTGFLAAWSSRAPALDAVIPCANGHFVIGPLDFMRTESGWKIFLNDEAVIDDAAHKVLDVLADILKTAAPAPDERADAERFRWLLDNYVVMRDHENNDSRYDVSFSWDAGCVHGIGHDIRTLIDADRDRDREGAR